MPSSLASRDKDSPRKRAKGNVPDGRWWRSPLALILLISLGIHGIALLIFGGTVLFREKAGGMVFQAETAPQEKNVEADSPALEESPCQEMAEEAPPNEVGSPQEGVPAEAVVKLSGERGWAPPVRGEGRVPIAGFSGRGEGRGRGKAELFGTVVGDRKLGVIVDVSGSMQPYLERVLTEVLGNFPKAEVVLVDGCGMEPVRTDSAPPGSRARSGGRKRRPRTESDEPLVPPHVVELNSQEGLASPAIGGAGFLGGLVQSFPKVFDTLRNRSGTWIVVGEEADVATRLAFDQLAGHHVQAIYWFSDFEDSVEPGESEKAARIVKDNKIEMYLHPMNGLKNIRSWAGQVGAKVIEVKIQERPPKSLGKPKEKEQEKL